MKDKMMHSDKHRTDHPKSHGGESKGHFSGLGDMSGVGPQPKMPAARALPKGRMSGCMK
jgi:hypothetical protein